MRATVGTAGHIDHGKSALVRALTGIDPDRLPEEKARGISIELGFAYLATPSGDRVGIVDVPGHERFIRQMLAGAQGFDYVLVVVAADDGVMPQTEEHFEICHLLGLREGAFVISKSDLVPPERVAEVREEIALLAEGTPFAHAPVFAVSAVTGDGVAALRSHLLAAVPRFERRASTGEPFRLPIDRVFVLKGHGVVVTGTALGGSVAPGDEVVVAPGGSRTRVREVQVHGVSAARAWSGQRIALNLASLGQEAVTRGKTVVDARIDAETGRLDARIEVRPAARRALRSQDRVRLYLGTADAAARIVWLGGVDEVTPKASAFAQLVLTRGPVVALPGDRFVLRDETGERTLGGGMVLVAPAPKRSRLDAAVVEHLSRLDAESPAIRIDAYLALRSDLGATLEEIARGARLDRDEVVDSVGTEGMFVRLGGDGASGLVATRGSYDAYVATLLERVRIFHADTPSAAGLELERLRQELEPVLDARVFRMIVDTLTTEGLVERRGGVIADASHRPSMTTDGERIGGAVLAALSDAGAMPPTLTELQERHAISAAQVQEILGVLAARGAVVKVSSDLYFARDAMAAIESHLREHLAKHGSITAAGFRDLIAATRRYSIPLLDHFDRSGLTVRTGDYRQLRPGG